jgi:UTP:GlnB (protein PII) uridylyltransferase
MATAATQPAVERFMRRYFLIAKEVGALTRVFAPSWRPSEVKSASRTGNVALHPVAAR